MSREVGLVERLGEKEETAKASSCRSRLFFFLFCIFLFPKRLLTSHAPQTFIYPMRAFLEQIGSHFTPSLCLCFSPSPRSSRQGGSGRDRRRRLALADAQDPLAVGLEVSARLDACSRSMC